MEYIDGVVEKYDENKDKFLNFLDFNKFITELKTLKKNEENTLLFKNITIE